MAYADSSEAINESPGTGQEWVARFHATFHTTSHATSHQCPSQRHTQRFTQRFTQHFARQTAFPAPATDSRAAQESPSSAESASASIRIQIRFHALVVRIGLFFSRLLYFNAQLYGGSLPL